MTTLLNIPSWSGRETISRTFESPSWSLSLSPCMIKELSVSFWRKLTELDTTRGSITVHYPPICGMYSRRCSPAQFNVQFQQSLIGTVQCLLLLLSLGNGIVMKTGTACWGTYIMVSDILARAPILKTSEQWKVLTQAYLLASQHKIAWFYSEESRVSNNLYTGSSTEWEGKAGTQWRDSLQFGPTHTLMKLISGNLPAGQQPASKVQRLS